MLALPAGHRKRARLKLTKKRDRQLHTAFDLMVEHYGKSKFYSRLPILKTFYDPSALYKNRQVMGDFEAPFPPQFPHAEIWINFASCTNMRSAVKVIIHEYMHYLQSPSWYTRYLRTYGYDENPYEIEADRVADEDFHLFWPLDD